jgi:NodT family efflux transporter outer membrane factor (OMF) lipoprotein
LAALPVAGLLASCAVGPNFVRPPAPGLTHYSHGADPTGTVIAGGTAQHVTAGASVATDWWHLFKSPDLDDTISEVLANNPGLDAAEASLRQSEDNLRSGYGIFYPQIGIGGGASRQLYSAVKVGQSAQSSLFNLFTLSASASYALDIFGGERRALEALGAQVDIQRATERATYVTLVANVVNTVVAAGAYRAEIDATKDLIDLQRQQLELTQVQAQAGTVPYSTVLSVQSQLSSYEAQLPQLEQRLVQCNDLLASLAGRAPARWSPRRFDLAELNLPEVLPLTLPSDLVRQRPDILAAEATAHAASASIGVATAALLPAVTLSGSYSASGTTTGSLFASSGRAWNAAGGIVAPVFEGGTLWFKRKAAIDSYEQAMALYQQTVLAAFAQVADVLSALEHDALSLRAQEEALQAAKTALRLVQVNYEAGLSTYLDVMAADAQYHQASINELQAVAVRYQDTVALYVALGGGWWITSGVPHD